MRSTVFDRRGVMFLLAASPIAFVHRADAAADPAPVDLGPRAVTRMTARQVVEHGRNEQVVRLRGRIVSHEGGQNYTFRDDTGSLPVSMAHARLPGNQTLRTGQRVELVGEIHKMVRHQLELNVSKVQLIQ